MGLNEVILSVDDVFSLMEIQRDLNEMFDVPRWDSSIVETALICEYSEMMNEIQSKWKVWKKVQDNELDAKIEFIDCVHFMLSSLLLRHDVDSDGINIFLELDESLGHGDFLEHINMVFKQFLVSESTFPNSVKHFREFVYLFTTTYEMSREEFFFFFETKKKINMERAASGYSEGNYSGKDLERERFQ